MTFRISLDCLFISPSCCLSRQSREILKVAFFGTPRSLAVINSVLPWFSSLVSLRFLFLDRFSLDRILGLKICIQVLHSSHLMSTPHRHKKPPTHSHNSLVHHHHGHPRPHLPPRPPAHPRIAPQTPSHPRPAVAEPS